MSNEILPALTGRNGHLATTAVEGFPMQEPEETTQSGLNVHEILLMLFRHKWKILLCAASGLIASMAVYFLLPPIYESEAKLFVRYVVDKSAVDGLDAQIKTPNPHDGYRHQFRSGDSDELGSGSGGRASDRCRAADAGCWS